MAGYCGKHPFDKLRAGLEQQYSRNPRIVRVLFEMGYIEEIGMGLDNVYRWLAEAGQSEPALRDTGGSFIITFYGLDMEKALAEERAEAIDLARLGLNERQVGAVLYVREHGRISNREYRELFGVSNYTAATDLKDLVEKQILVAEGMGRGRYYRLAVQT